MSFFFASTDTMFLHTWYGNSMLWMDGWMDGWMNEWISTGRGENGGKWKREWKRDVKISSLFTIIHDYGIGSSECII